MPATDDRDRTSDSSRRVVVTGIGMVTPLGLNVATTWDNLTAARSGTTYLDLEHTRVKVMAPIPAFDAAAALAGVVLPKDLRRLSRAAQLSLAAGIEAATDAGLLAGAALDGVIDRTRTGVRIGTGIGGATEIPRISESIKAGRRLTPFDTLIVEPERVASVVSMKLGLQGPLAQPSAACATGNIAITDAFKDIAFDEADVMLAGGAESTLDYVTLEMFRATGALSPETDPRRAPFASRPFDASRNGFVMGEGAGVLVLEELGHARRRGARIYAELIGFGNAADAGGDTDPSGDGAERALRRAMSRAGCLPADAAIYVNAHATATPVGDAVELAMIRRALPCFTRIAVSSTKGSIGHLMGAAGAVEAIISILALHTGVLPPTINLHDPIAAPDGVELIANQARVRLPDLVINNAFGFGGINSTTVFARPR